MPSIFQATCSACEYKSPSYSEGYLAVILDEPSSSKHTHQDDRRLVILAHPGEGRILDELGFNYESAALAGRLLYVRKVVCRSCGTSYEIRRIGGGTAALGISGCLAFFGLASSVGTLIGWQGESLWNGFICGSIVFFALTAIVEFALSRFLRLRHKDRIAEFDRRPGCSKCGCKDYIRSRGSLWRKLICPQCGKHSVQVGMVSRS